jgi:hypothetical protein
MDIHWSIWGSNTGRSKRTISSPKHTDKLHHPPSLQLNENQSFFPGSKVARAVSLTTYINLEPSVKITGATPPHKLSASMTHNGTNLLYLKLLIMYIFLKRSHSFWSYKGTRLYITYPLHAHYMTHLFHQLNQLD